MKELRTMTFEELTKQRKELQHTINEINDLQSNMLRGVR